MPRSKVPASKQSKMRRFVFDRVEDQSGVSGTGAVAEGVVFSNGRVALTWLSPLTSVAVYDNMDIVKNVHGHDGSTKIVFIDEEE